ncbi:protein MHF2 homolog isoform X3 [Manihot esculenta]|uniref:Uncharacterized protein n=2 Tax=Manihot esculenta TaxID=3983 RepID=A0ACB7HP47_MANES|nr:protein MHF2 homolog isoform X3 [Manihot esculenta]XP_043813475.1 protein MHF2 homolog isoform X3 [Manihot esculenta]KAG8652631.1 hypothetical protein MANES_06G112300v8 [Manihot esculenta]OAY47872.1 hypothetical protein MANES_06G112300v8 [Manihot esculenta]
MKELMLWTARSLLYFLRSHTCDFSVFFKVGVGTSKKIRPTSANSNAVKLSCELLRVFVAEAVQRAAAIAEAEGVSKIEATHLERILPQLLMDF